MDKSEYIERTEIEGTGNIETLHNDEGVKVLTAYEGDPNWEPGEEKRLVRKLDRSLLVILCCTYGLQWYDKGMLSQAVSSPEFQVAESGQG